MSGQRPEPVSDDLPPSSPPTEVPRYHPAAPDGASLPSSRDGDENDIGWGDGPSRYDDEWYLRERPPHHG